MRTLGIDLATTHGSTGICEIDWHRRTATVRVGQVDDAEIARAIQEVQRAGGWTAIDAPFGFPEAFTLAVSDWWEKGAVVPDSDHDIRRRVTDCCIAHRQAEIKELHLPGGWNPWPLSSVVDLITPTVIRCARILTTVDEGRPLDRIGLSSRIIEAYPISCLRAWGITTGRYKSDAADCEAVLTELCQRAGLPRPEPVGSVPKGGEDDAVDALVCALLARAVALEPTATGPEAAGDPWAGEVAAIRQEGWIHMPPRGHRLEALRRTP